MKGDPQELHGLLGRPEMAEVQAALMQRIVAFDLQLREIPGYVARLNINQRPFMSAPHCNGLFGGLVVLPT